MAELEDIHSSQEDSIMHVFHNVGKTIEKIEDSCKFADRILTSGNCTEVLLMKRLITTQLLSLVNNTTVPDVSQICCLQILQSIFNGETICQ